MGFLKKIFKESVSVHKNIGRMGVKLAQGDLSGAAAAHREAGRTVVHGLKRDLLGDNGGSTSNATTSGSVSGGGGNFALVAGGRYGQMTAYRSYYQQMLHACGQLGNQWRSMTNG